MTEFEPLPEPEFCSTEHTTPPSGGDRQHAAAAASDDDRNDDEEVEEPLPALVDQSISTEKEHLESAASNGTNRTTAIATAAAIGSRHSSSSGSRPSTAMSARDRRLEERLTARHQQHQQHQHSTVAAAVTGSQPSSQLERLRAVQACYVQPKPTAWAGSKNSRVGGGPIEKVRQPSHPRPLAAALPSKTVVNGVGVIAGTTRGEDRGAVIVVAQESTRLAKIPPCSSTAHYTNYSARGRAGRGGARIVVQEEAAGMPSHPTPRPRTAGGTDGSTHRRSRPHHMW